MQMIISKIKSFKHTNSSELIASSPISKNRDSDPSREDDHIMVHTHEDIFDSKEDNVNEL